MRTHGIHLGTTLTACLFVAASGCAPQEELALLDAIAPPPPNAVRCATTPHDVSETIGPRGGAITAETATPAGVRSHSLIVPAGAVVQGEQAVFRLVEPQNGYVVVHATHNAPSEAVGSVTLRLSYAGCDVSPEDTVGLRMYRFQDGGWESVPSRHLWQEQIVEADRDDLSAYALGAG